MEAEADGWELVEGSVPEAEAPSPPSALGRVFTRITKAVGGWWGSEKEVRACEDSWPSGGRGALRQVLQTSLSSPRPT
jgi:hypothetical protein